MTFQAAFWFPALSNGGQVLLYLLSLVASALLCGIGFGELLHGWRGMRESSRKSRIQPESVSESKIDEHGNAIPVGSWLTLFLVCLLATWGLVAWGYATQKHSLQPLTNIHTWTNVKVLEKSPDRKSYLVYCCKWSQPGVWKVCDDSLKGLEWNVGMTLDSVTFTQRDDCKSTADDRLGWYVIRDKNLNFVDWRVTYEYDPRTEQLDLSDYAGGRRGQATPRTAGPETETERP